MVQLILIIDILADNPNASLRGISEEVGINPSAVQKHINALKSKGCLVRIGGTRGYWHIAMTKL